MPTVSIIGTLPPVKGLSAYTRELCEAVAEHWSVDFIGFQRLYPEWLYPGGTTDPTETELVLDNVVQRHFLTWYNPVGWVRAGLTARGHVVHAQWWSYILAPVYWTLLSMIRMKKRPVVLTLHNIVPHEIKPLPLLLNRSVLRLSDAFIVHSEANRDTLLKRYGIPAVRVRVIPHGPLRTLAQPMSREEARDRLGLREADRTVLFFGAIRDYKGLDVLIHAFKSMKLPGKKLLIAGKVWESQETYVELLKGNPSIIFHEGYVPRDKVPVYMQAADLVVLPYRYFESASGVGGLALAYHVPLLVSNVGSLPELVTRKEICVCAPNDSAELADKMKRILSNPDLQEELKEDTRIMETQFSWKSIGERTIALYEDMLKRGHS